MYDGYAYSSSALTNSSLTANITGNEIAFTQPGSAQTELVALSNGNVSVPNTGANTKTFYFVVAPSTSKPHEITFMINGDSRTLKKSLAFEAGKVTRFTVPINDLKHPHTSDALTPVSTGIATNGRKLLDLGTAVKANVNDQPKATINGQPNVLIYPVGDGSQGDLIVRGSTKDIINALDAGFYAANWPGKRSAMTLSLMQLYIDGVKFSEHSDFRTGFKNILTDALGKFLGSLAWGLAGDGILSQMANGIPRDGDLLALTRFIDPQTITFNGVLECGASDDHSQILIFNNEEHIYKGIDGNMLDRFLGDNSTTMGGKFIYNNIKPTYQGLKDIVNYDSETITIESDEDISKIPSGEDQVNNNGLTYAQNTAYAIYNKLYTVLGEKTFSLGSYITLRFSQLFNVLIPSQAGLVTMLPNMEFEITISTCDYYKDKAIYATKENDKYKYTLTNLQTSLNPIVFWGLDAYGPNASSLATNAE